MCNLAKTPTFIYSGLALLNNFTRQIKQGLFKEPNPWLYGVMLILPQGCCKLLLCLKHTSQKRRKGPELMGFWSAKGQKTGGMLSKAVVESAERNFLLLSLRAH